MQNEEVSPLKFYRPNLISGLMEKTTMENLGLASGDQNDWKSEKQERDSTFGKINKIKEQAYLRALRERRRQEVGSMPDNFPKDLVE